MRDADRQFPVCVFFNFPSTPTNSPGPEPDQLPLLVAEISFRAHQLNPPRISCSGRTQLPLVVPQHDPAATRISGPSIPVSVGQLLARFPDRSMTVKSLPHGSRPRFSICCSFSRRANSSRSGASSDMVLRACPDFFELFFFAKETRRVPPENPWRKRKTIRNIC